MVVSGLVKKSKQLMMETRRCELVMKLPRLREHGVNVCHKPMCNNLALQATRRFVGDGVAGAATMQALFR